MFISRTIIVLLLTSYTTAERENTGSIKSKWKDRSESREILHRRERMLEKANTHLKQLLALLKPVNETAACISKTSIAQQHIQEIYKITLLLQNSSMNVKKYKSAQKGRTQIVSSTTTKQSNKEQSATKDTQKVQKITKHKKHSSMKVKKLKSGKKKSVRIVHNTVSSGTSNESNLKNVTKIQTNQKQQIEDNKDKKAKLKVLLQTILPSIKGESCANLREKYEKLVEPLIYTASEILQAMWQYLSPQKITDIINIIINPSTSNDMNGTESVTSKHLIERVTHKPSARIYAHSQSPNHFTKHTTQDMKTTLHPPDFENYAQALQVQNFKEILKNNRTLKHLILQALNTPITSNISTTSGVGTSTSTPPTRQVHPYESSKTQLFINHGSSSIPNESNKLVPLQTKTNFITSNKGWPKLLNHWKIHHGKLSSLNNYSKHPPKSNNVLEPSTTMKPTSKILSKIPIERNKKLNTQATTESYSTTFSGNVWTGVQNHLHKSRSGSKTDLSGSSKPDPNTGGSKSKGPKSNLNSGGSKTGPNSNGSKTSTNSGDSNSGGSTTDSNSGGSKIDSNSGGATTDSNNGRATTDSNNGRATTDSNSGGSNASHQRLSHNQDEKQKIAQDKSNAISKFITWIKG